jgi:triosephosphate isomerase
MSHSRPTVITGNWKMYKTIDEAVRFVKELAPLVQESTAQVYLAVPFTAIHATAEVAKSTKIVIGAQNMNDASEGAFTGEIAARMLKEAGAKFVILGHSERRKIFHETNSFINKKVKRALIEGLQPILCVGETKEEREQNKTAEVLESQISQSLADLSAEQLASLILAYEPVWAIGTDLAATPEMAQKEHEFCRSIVAKNWGSDFAEHLVIQYGGSVKPDNAKALLEQPDIDGLLVGGASLSVDSFSKIVNSQKI